MSLINLSENNSNAFLEFLCIIATKMQLFSLSIFGMLITTLVYCMFMSNKCLFCGIVFCILEYVNDETKAFITSILFCLC